MKKAHCMAVALQMCLICMPRLRRDAGSSGRLIRRILDGKRERLTYRLCILLNSWCRSA
jgi:hypothetical protein